MPQPPSSEARPLPTPTFYLTARRPIRPEVLLLATLTAGAALFGIVHTMSHAARMHLADGSSGPSRSAAGNGAEDDKDDPNQIDTIVLGDPSEAPVPKHGDHVSPVHPTIVVRLPRFGDQFGLIPNSPAGQLLYRWLAAFNQTNAGALQAVLPTVSPASTAAQLALRHRNGGFNLLSSKEVAPGVLVFRLLDQTPAATEVLGTLQARPDSRPAAIASFSLRAVDPIKPPPEPPPGISSR